MALVPVRFEYLTGLHQPFLVNARLTGSWDAQGLRSEQWTEVPMTAFTAEDGCPAFRATVNLDDGQIGQEFRWGVSVDTMLQPNVWGIPTEVNDPGAIQRYRSFPLRGPNQVERYYFTHCRRLGANKLWVNRRRTPAIGFAVWAPNARQVELVCGEPVGGYIFNDGRGVTATLPMQRGEAGIWTTSLTDSSELFRFTDFDHTPYMFRITKDDGSVAYRTDLYSRCQIGSGNVNPELDPSWSGRRQDLDGSKSCSVVVDPERVTTLFHEGVWPETQWLSADEFWQNEFDPNHPLPTRLEDLVIYELHVDGLGLDRGVDAGTLEDAIRLLDYLVDLGVNAIELMPMSEFQGRIGWGYSTSHYFAIEYAGGGRDQFKHFVRECHRRGIAVILDVVYNHYTFDSERAEWAYDSNTPENNIYYWYEGRARDYPNPDGGYIDNGSSGWGPRFWEEMVRRMFTSSAAALVSEFHFDGFRVDLTTAIHRDAVVHADGRPVNDACIFGQKFLREWTQTLRLVKPNIFLIAEDHSGWAAVTQPVHQGGLGFDATWYADFYHDLIGDAQNDPIRARLLKMAGYGDNRPLALARFAAAPANSAYGKITYHESHDEAGNSYHEEEGQRVYSARTIMVAVNDAPLVGETRRYAEARVHFAAGMTLLGPGIPMFFMGEEVGASRPYRYADFLNAREDYPALRRGAGANLFRFYQDLIRLRLSRLVLRSHNIDIIYTHDANRVLAFRRWEESEELLIVASLNNTSFIDGYGIQNPRLIDGQWREIFNSDAAAYGGSGLANQGLIPSASGEFTVRMPANSVLVFQRQR
ncbi:MAG: alpha-amylase family glycosyl hydrolase [Deltaproteobacteria bacterium]|nr:alpha-amylase family glycosyl hydrolase [Deltaproteobacteria bacterium]